FLDLVQALSAEVLRLEHLGFGLLHQLANRADVRVLETVVGPDRELELLYALVQILVADPEPRLVDGCVRLLLRALLEIDEDVQMIPNQLGRERDGVAGADRSVRPHVDRKLVVVGRLSEPGGLYQIVDLLDRRVHGVDGDPADAQILVEVLVRRDVSAAALHAHLHVELAAFGDGGNVRVRLENLDVRVGLDVARSDFARLVDAQHQRFRVIDVELERNLLEIEDDIGGVFDDAGNG